MPRPRVPLALLTAAVLAWRCSSSLTAPTPTPSASITVGALAHVVTQTGRPAAPCVVDITPTSAAFDKDGGVGDVAVSAGDGCEWSAVSSDAWVAVTSAAQGVGAGTVSYRVDRNTGAGARSGSIRVADRTLALTQSADVGVCQYSVTPVVFTPCLTGRSVTVQVSTESSCSWSAASSAPWLTVADGASGTGPGSVVATFGDNYDAPREAVVMVRWPTPTAGQNVRVAQAGCRYGVSKSALSFAAAGGMGTFDVLQQSDPTECGGPLQDACVWTAVSGAAWITITTGMPRRGDNPVAFAVAASPSVSPRTGTITVRGVVVQITQSGG